MRGGSPIWATVYADMMTNLTLFFLMLFALNLFGEETVKKASESFKAKIEGKTAPELKIAKEKPKNIMEDILKKFEEEEKDEDIQIQKGGEGIRLLMPEPVLFGLGKAKLKPEARKILHRLADTFKKLTNTVVIEGHTDNVPIVGGKYRDNWELSMARAESVLNYLIYAEGISPNRLAIAGYGEYLPIVDNKTAKHRAMNRRIELLVLYEKQS